MIERNGPGRPAKYRTDEERKAARLAYARAHRGKIKNVTLDADLVQILNDKADALVAEFGFRPTLSQTVRYLIRSIDR